MISRAIQWTFSGRCDPNGRAKSLRHQCDDRGLKGTACCRNEASSFVISIITKLELLAWPRITQEERVLVREMLSAIEVAQITTEIEEKVIEIRTTCRLKLPDAIIAATATSLGAPLVTNDSGFRKVQGLIVESF
ncbi:MAG: type II toxin-antitoxin system VapC family toxin [Fimbriimonadaceae bacterium]